MYDPAIVIIGGGYVGSVLALALAEHGLRCTIIERRPFTQDDHTHDTRHFGLTRDSREILQKLKLWTTLEADIVPIHQMTIRTNSESPRDMIALGQAEPHTVIGRMLAASRFQHSLHQAIQHHPLITARDATTLTALEPIHSGWKVLAQQGNECLSLNAELIVATDGAQSPTRTMLNIATSEKSYGQYAWQWRLAHTREHHGQAFEYLLPEGPYVVLPRVDPNHSKLIWCHSCPDIAPLEQQMSRYFPSELGDITDMIADTHYPLHRIQANQGYTQGAVLLGDAYLRVHPVGAQGLNLGLRDAWALAKHLARDQQAGIAIGAEERLAAYHRTRRQDRQQIKFLTDMLGDRVGKIPAPFMAVASKALQTPPAKRLVHALFHGE